jgi:hypothetical protein
MKISDSRLDKENIFVTLYAFTFDGLSDRDEAVFALHLFDLELRMLVLDVCLHHEPNERG